MRLSHLDNTSLSNLHGTLISPKENKDSVSGFEAEMLSSAIARLKAATKEKDIDTMKLTIDLLHDFTRDEAAKLSLKEMLRYLAKCDFKGAETLIDAL